MDPSDTTRNALNLRLLYSYLQRTPQTTITNQPLVPSGVINSFPDQSLLIKRSQLPIIEDTEAAIQKKLLTDPSLAMLAFQNRSSQLINQVNQLNLMKLLISKNQPIVNPLGVLSPKIEGDPAINSVIKQEPRNNDQLITKFEETEKHIPTFFPMQNPVIYSQMVQNQLTIPDIYHGPEDHKLVEELQNRNQSTVVEPPALVELTKLYPDWDLATIFTYIFTGNTEELPERKTPRKHNNSPGNERNNNVPTTETQTKMVEEFTKELCSLLGYEEINQQKARLMLRKKQWKLDYAIFTVKKNYPFYKNYFQVKTKKK